ncbi:26S proteasome regulatory subunit 4-like [Centruroides vittatus]|uniref:26S proteasome regulatory subunit 4-like n=1 Tax=Centruroides vittatus TaxID=120091 RepID=UPI00350F70DD
MRSWPSKPNKKKDIAIPVEMQKRKVKTENKDAAKLPRVTFNKHCRLKILKMERIKDYLVMEEEFLRNQQNYTNKKFEEVVIVEVFRDYPLVVGEMKEPFEGNFTIVSTPEGVPIVLLVDKTKLQSDSSVLLDDTDCSISGIIEENADSSAF